MTQQTQVASSLDWIRDHLIRGGGIAVSHRQRRPYPEVTGYLIPTLLDAGHRDLAENMLRWLRRIQGIDGSFRDPAGAESYAFDTGQVLRGFCAALEFDRTLESHARRAADWILSTSDSSGRLKRPSSPDAWDLGDRGAISEAVHLFCLPPLAELGHLLDEPRYLDFARKSLDYYLKNSDVTRFESPEQLTHLFCYVQDALFDLGAKEQAEAGMRNLARFQRDDGACPAYFDVDWICSPGQIQAAIVWQKLGQTERATKALEFAESLVMSNGGLPGSVGKGASYFADDQPSWAVKFHLDARRLILDKKHSTSSPAAGAENHQDAAAAPSIRLSAEETSKERRGKTLDSNLAPDEWHDSIAGDVDSRGVADRVRMGQVPPWVNPVLERTVAGQRVLELGSGTGELSAALAKAGRDVTLIDFSEKSLELARGVFDTLSLKGEYVQADVSKTLPFADGHFDCVWSSGLLEHFEDDQISWIVQESARITQGIVVSLVPNAMSFPYRLGKWHQETTGQWVWGREDPKHELKTTFEAAGLIDVEEFSISDEHALEFLEMPGGAALKNMIRRFYASLDAADLEAMRQGYLLVTVGKKPSRESDPQSAEESAEHTATPPKAEGTGSRGSKPMNSKAATRTRRLAVLPHDPLHEYEAAGYPDLTEYFNPQGLFDEVYCLSPYETERHRRYGLEVIPTAAKDLPARLRELDIDVVRAYDVFAGRIAANHRAFGIPLIVSVHDTLDERFAEGLPEADRFLAVSHEVRTKLLEHGAEAHRIESLPNRVDLDVFRPNPDVERRAAFASRFAGKYRVLHVGRRTEQKNLETTLEALSQLGEDYTGIFVGRGDDAPYREHARQLGIEDRCHFLDSVPNAELASWYQDADCLCVPSRWEGFGIIFIEALACGAAVISTDIAPMNEFMADGANALLTPDPEDAPGLAARIRMSCENEMIRDRIRKNAPEAAAPFGKDAVDEMEAAQYRAMIALRDSYRTPASCRTPDPAIEDVPTAASKTPLTHHGFEVKALDSASAKDWDRLIESSPDAWFFHRYDEQQLFQEAWPSETLSFLVEVDGRTVAACPVQRWNHDPSVLISSIMGTGGPAMAGDLTEGDRKQAANFCHGVLGSLIGQAGIREVRIQLPPGAKTSRRSWESGVSPLDEFGYRDVSTQANVLRVDRDLDELFAELHPSYRNDIRRARKDGIEIEIATDENAVETYYRMHEETYRRTGVEPHPRAYFEAIFRHFVKSGQALWFFARHEGRVIGATNIAHMNDFSLYWTGAYAQEALATRAGKLLQWEAISWAQENGMTWHESGEVFPLAEPPSKEAGLTLFKRRFGGHFVPFFKGILDAECKR